ncbi:MAG: NUDIX domain-containing protein [Lutibacter sp.]|uniref:NUDIX hydrolase n=1 Tax=Lutibacter sp. TaxID=1925666 RepID=UPI0019F4BAA8|nr:NUDIX domain-containing protein [Lutibacter sp.]NOR28242.1 NUDIX domain-containing protein [Lutibacter sp.]
MYKVFANDCSIILTDTNNFSTNFLKFNFNSCNISEIVETLFQNKTGGICLLCDDLETCWQKFQSVFKVQKAAGGKVLDSKNEVLFIYRLDKWDLPKGKLEKGESISECAIREVEEECGITNLQIENELQTTYHIFKRKGKTILKITYWFLMNTNYKGNLTPQIEEGIEKVEFKNSKETKEALKNTYENIKLLF